MVFMVFVYQTNLLVQNFNKLIIYQNFINSHSKFEKIWIIIIAISRFEISTGTGGGYCYQPKPINRYLINIKPNELENTNRASDKEKTSSIIQ